MSIELHSEADEFIRLTLCFELRKKAGGKRKRNGKCLENVMRILLWMV